MGLLYGIIANQGGGAASEPPPIPPMTGISPPADYLLYFSDDFDYVGPPDPARWGSPPLRTSNCPESPAVATQTQVFDPAYATVDGTKLILKATGSTPLNKRKSSVRSSDNKNLITSSITTGLTREWPSPGFLKLRVKTSRIRGVMNEAVLWGNWPWGYSGSGDATRNAEIDVFEARGLNPTHCSIGSHAWGSGAPAGLGQGGETFDYEPGVFHDFDCSWSNSHVRIWVDSDLRHDRDLANDTKPSVFGFPLVLSINCWIAASDSAGNKLASNDPCYDNWAGAAGVDFEALATGEAGYGTPGARMEVDYVHFYTPIGSHIGVGA